MLTPFLNRQYSKLLPCSSHTPFFGSSSAKKRPYSEAYENEIIILLILHREIRICYNKRQHTQYVATQLIYLTFFNQHLFYVIIQYLFFKQKPDLISKAIILLILTIARVCFWDSFSYNSTGIINNGGWLKLHRFDDTLVNHTDLQRKRCHFVLVNHPGFPGMSCVCSSNPMKISMLLQQILDLCHLCS